MNCIYCHQKCKHVAFLAYHCMNICNNNCKLEYILNEDQSIYRICFTLRNKYKNYIMFVYTLDYYNNKLLLFSSDQYRNCIFNSDTYAYVSPQNIEEFISNLVLL